MKNNVIFLDDNMSNMLSASLVEEETVIILTHYHFTFDTLTSDTDEKILHTAVSDYMDECDEHPARVIVIDDVPMNMCIKENNHESVESYMFSRIRNDNFIALNAKKIKK